MLWVLTLEIRKKVFLLLLFVKFLYFWHFQVQKVCELHLWWLLHFFSNYQTESYMQRSILGLVLGLVKLHVKGMPRPWTPKADVLCETWICDLFGQLCSDVYSQVKKYQEKKCRGKVCVYTMDWIVPHKIHMLKSQTLNPKSPMWLYLEIGLLGSNWD